MKRPFLFKPLCIIILIVANLVGCTNKNSENNKKENILLKEIQSDSHEDISYFRFPSPEEIFDYIEYSDLEYKPGIPNEPDNCNTYTLSNKQALNLGVYISDLAYLSFFGNTEQTHMYLSSIHKLSGKLKLDGAFSFDFIERANKNINNVDSLTLYSEIAYKKIVTYLEETNNNRTLALLSIGTYVESLYLILNYIDDYDKQSDMVQRIADQHFAFENLNDFILVHLNSESDQEYIKMVADIMTVFEGMEKVTKKAEATSAKSDMMVLDSGDSFRLTEEGLNNMKKIVYEKRGILIKY